MGVGSEELAVKSQKTEQPLIALPSAKGAREELIWAFNPRFASIDTVRSFWGEGSPPAFSPGQSGPGEGALEQAWS